MGRTTQGRLGRRAHRFPRVAALAVVVALAGCGGTDSADPPPDPGRAQDKALTADRARQLRADETGQVMVLEYHRVGGDPDFAPEWTISARAFRRELEYLRRNGYHPVNARDFLTGRMDVPAGKTPVVLTFDDSSDTQFTLVRRDGKLVPDPGGAVGVLVDFHRRHPTGPCAGHGSSCRRPTRRTTSSASPPRRAQAPLPRGGGHGDRLPHALPRRPRQEHPRPGARAARAVGHGDPPPPAGISRGHAGRPVRGVSRGRLAAARGRVAGPALPVHGRLPGRGRPVRPAGHARLRPVPGPAHPDGARRRADARGLPRGRARPGPPVRLRRRPADHLVPQGHAARLDLEALHAAGYTFRGY
jgi:hypothetical protein